MELRHLQYIAEIVRCNNFTRAAENLNVTQPTISKMIQNLEKELNADIFVRSGRQIQLTDVGEAILQHSGPILQMFESLKTEINDLTFLNKGSIRIGLPPMAGSSFFPDVIKKIPGSLPGDHDEDGRGRREQDREKHRRRLAGRRHIVMAGRSGGIRFISDREGSVKGRDASRTPVSGPGANRAGRTGTGAVYIFLTAISPCMTGSRTHAVRRASFPASYPKAPSGI